MTTRGAAMVPSRDGGGVVVGEFNRTRIRMVVLDGVRWWVLRDVLVALGLGANATWVHGRLSDDEFSFTKLVDARGRRQRTCVVNREGLNMVLLRSNSPAAVPFQRWIAHEVVPSIQDTGAYLMPGADERASVGRAVEVVVTRALVPLHARIEDMAAVLNDLHPPTLRRLRAEIRSIRRRVIRLSAQTARPLSTQKFNACILPPGVSGIFEESDAGIAEVRLALANARAVERQLRLPQTALALEPVYA